MVDRFLADERRRRWSGRLLVLLWTVSLTGLLLSTASHALGKVSFVVLRQFLADLLAPGIVVVPALLAVVGYAAWMAFRERGEWTILSLALLFQAPVCLLLTVQRWAARQFLVPQVLVFCVLAALVVAAAATAWRGREPSLPDSGRRGRRRVVGTVAGGLRPKRSGPAARKPRSWVDYGATQGVAPDRPDGRLDGRERAGRGAHPRRLRAGGQRAAGQLPDVPGRRAARVDETAAGPGYLPAEAERPDQLRPRSERPPKNTARCALGPEDKRQVQGYLPVCARTCNGSRARATQATWRYQATTCSPPSWDCRQPCGRAAPSILPTPTFS